MLDTFLYLFICIYACISVGEAAVCEGKTCGECLASSSECGWCSDEELFTGSDESRCATVTSLEVSGCDRANISEPVSTVPNSVNKDLSDGDSEGRDAVQLRPQRLTIRSTPNYKKTIEMTFRAARNYPVDLYFLFDLSNTMKEHKAKLASLGGLLAQKMGEISKNYKFGFGYFQDKVILPFSYMIPSKLQQPCPNCAPPFGYRHRLSLTDNIEEFKNAVSGANVTGNIDNPEGGFDAIMQAVACETQIGWRKQARKLIIYSSDSTFHYAGDGKLAGIVLPNDGECHLDEMGKNPEELNQDYPSIGQISQKVKEKNVNIIFAILAKVEDDYNRLTKQVPNSVVGVLEGNSENIVTIVKENYEAIISEVRFKVTSPDGIIVQLYSDCNRGTRQKTTKCDGLSIGKEVAFDVEILATECPKNREDWNKTITIQADGMPDSLTINFQIECECGCEKSGQGESDSSKCNYVGTYQCGICSCNEGYYGDICECSEFDILGETQKRACQSENTTILCMGRGTCNCGQCDCNPGYTGRYCGCDTNACGRVNGEVCGGPLRGRCDCETCVCLDGYTGPKCDCPTSQDTCLSNDGELCGGKGICKCGQCICESGYIGTKCETCPTCPGECLDNRDCVECKVFKQGSLSPEQCDLQCTNLQIVETINDKNGTCEIKDIDGCKMVFKINYEADGNHTIVAQKYKVCPQDVDIIPIVAGVMGGIVAIGIFLLVLWKILTSLYDGVEYSRFQREVDQVRWAQESNPIYKGATSTYKNPLCDDMSSLDSK
ncbi:hypothetical protein SNE40_022499 [Patella caerulea]|uniref:Integrin beta n=1 Tax=Patella caerulea TaxID=87958 RepID=A0AAN8IV30_PATCE